MVFLQSGSRVFDVDEMRGSMDQFCPDCGVDISQGPSQCLIPFCIHSNNGAELILEAITTFGTVLAPLIPGHNRASTLPTDATTRKRFPVASGVLDYFPDAIVALAELSYVGNEQHNPGEPLHWARGKSMDQDDTLIRHFMERGKIDSDGIRHSTKCAWRCLALLQLEIETAQEGA